MSLGRLCIAAALASTISFFTTACNGGDSGIPMTPGVPSDSDGSDSGGMAIPQSTDSPEAAPEETPAETPSNEATAPPVPSGSTPAPAALVPQPLPAKAVSLRIPLADKTIPKGSYLWIDGAIRPHDGASVAFSMQDSHVTVAGRTYAGPTGIVTVAPDVRTATVRSMNDKTIASAYPSTFSKPLFADGILVYLPAGLPAHQTVVWTARFKNAGSASGAKLQWQATAAAYSRFSKSYASLGIDASGSPKKFAKNFIGNTRSKRVVRSVTI